MDKQKTVKAGKLLCIDSGVYSNYSVHGIFVVLQDFDPQAELSMYLDVNPIQREAYCFQETSFLAALLAKGLLVEIEHGTLHLTDYMNHEEFRFTPTNG